MPVIQRGSWLVLALLLLQFVARGELSLRAESPVWDERLHGGYGLALLDRGPDFDGQDHPYLLAAALTLPVWLQLTGPERFAQADFDRPELLLPARRANLALATAGLLLLWLWARRQHGEPFAGVVLAIAALDPSWLAQARYLTTDIGHALGWWLASWSLVAHGQTRDRRWLLAAAAGVALGLASKWSALALPALLPLLWLSDTADRWAPVRAGAPALLWATVLGGLLLLVVFDALALGHGLPLDTAWDHLSRGLQASVRKRTAARGVYLLGAWWPTGTTWYFPVLLLAKSPLVTLLLGVLGLLWKPARRIWLTDRAWLLVLAAFLGLAITSRQNLGHRHLTPFLPAMWWLGASAALALARQLPTRRWVLPALVALVVVEGATAHPHYLAFANAAWGGPERVPPVAVDAAADWGQALPALRGYLHAHPASRVDLAYFGNTDPRAYVGATVWRPCGVLGRASGTGQLRAAPGEPTPLLAVSATCLYGGAGVRRGGAMDLTRRDDAWDYLRGREPEAVVGGSIWVFRDVAGDAAR